MLQSANLNQNQALLPLLSGLLEAIVVEGHLTVIDVAGRRSSFGDARSKVRATVRIHDRYLPWKIALIPSLALGEAYMDGRLTIEEGGLREFLAIVTANLEAIDTHPLQSILQKFSFLRPHFRRRNHERRARANVAHHYDLSDALYRLFLDDDLQYSCAYFTDRNDTLEAAQAAKKNHLAVKLLLEPGVRVLDIGCGWGGLALHLAKDADVEVKGITLSKEQLAVA